MEWLSQGIEVLIDRLRSGGDRAGRFDVVVVGSGYGGSVAAARLAGATKANGDRVSLCLLERGKEYLPGEFPNHMRDFPGHVRVDQHDKDEIYGRPDALFDYRSNPDVNVLVGNALGGGSQINAAVALPASAEVFGSEPWPSAFHCDRHYMERWYAKASAMLGVEHYPDDDDNPKLAKLAALKELAQSYSRRPYVPPKYTFAELRHYMNGEPIQGRGVPDTQPRPRAPEFCRLPLAITFDGKNEQGVTQHKCLECGDCCSGCNYWSKNTLTMNYLPLAYRRGAEIYTGAKVLRVLRAGKQADKPWRVEFIRTAYEKEYGGAQESLGKARSDAAMAVSHVLADVVILAAGTLGSTEILLRSRKPVPDKNQSESGGSDANGARLALSDTVGTRFSCNGDMIAVGYGQSRPVYPVGCGAEDPATRRNKTGPMAVGMIDFRKADNDGCPLIIEDGAIPGMLKRLYGEIITTAGMIAQFTEDDVKDDLKHDPLAVSEKTVESSQVYLLMGLDSASGRLSLERVRGQGLASDFKRKGISVHWPDAAKVEPVYAAQKRLMEQVRSLGAIPIMSPLWQILPEKLVRVLEGSPPEGKLITVHPLGGCPMGDNKDTASVNDMGEVFDGHSATSVHKGLFVCDGSIIPTALAVNPLLTITALAERNVELMAKERKWALDASDQLTLPAPPRPTPYRESVPQPIALSLRERLTGVLRDIEHGSVMSAFGLSEGCTGPREQRDTDGERRALGPVATRPGEHQVTIDLVAPIRDLDHFLRDPAHQAERVQIARLLIDRQVVPPRRLDDFEGSFGFLVREPANRAQRIYRSLRHWWSTRGYASSLIKDRRYLAPILAKILTDDRNRYGDDAQGFDVSVRRSLELARDLHRARNAAGDTEAQAAREAFEDEVLSVLRVANQTGERRRFLYEFRFTGIDGERYTLRGEKHIRYALIPSRRADSTSAQSATEDNNPWRSIARLTTELLRTRSNGAPMRVAEGELMFDFVDMARNTERWPQVVSETDAPSAYLALGSLALFYARALAQIYFWAFRVPYDLKTEAQSPLPQCMLPGQYFSCPPTRVELGAARAEDNPAEDRPEATPWPGRLDGIDGPIYHWRGKIAEDADWHTAHPDTDEFKLARAQAALLLTRYRGRKGESPEQQLERSPVVLIPGFAHSTRIFALTTLSTNLVRYLIDRKYDVWLLDPRTSSGLTSSWEQSELEEVAINDFPSALRHVLRIRAREHDRRRVPAPGQLSVVAHCMGAAQFMIAALAGELTRPDGTSWVRNAVLSQVGLVAVGSASNKLRGELVAMIRDQLGREYVDCRVTADDAKPLDVIADGLASTYPLHADSIDNHTPEPGNSRGFGIAVCNRITALYGHNWAHQNLNEATHAALGEILGNANMQTFAQLVHFVQNNRLSDRDGENRYVTYANIIQHLNFPVTLVYGEHNDVFDPATALRSYRLLKRTERWADYGLKKRLLALYRIARRATPDARGLDALNSTLNSAYALAPSLIGKITGANAKQSVAATPLLEKQLEEFERRLSQQLAGPDLRKRYAELRPGIMRFTRFLDARRLDAIYSIKDYVHLDCIIGQNAGEHVYPKIAAGLSGSQPSDAVMQISLPEDQDEECADDDSARERAEQGWWWTRAPHAGPILGWTRIEGGQLKARLWIMPQDNASRADDRVEQADAAYAEARLWIMPPDRDSGTGQETEKTAPAYVKLKDPRWVFLHRVAPVPMFERVASMDIAIDPKRIDPRGMLLRIAGMHALPRNLALQVDKLLGRAQANALPAGDMPDDVPSSERLAFEDLPPPPPPRERSEIVRSLRFWRHIVTEEQKIEELNASEVHISAELVSALTATDRLAFLFGSCRYPATNFLQETGDRMFERMVSEINDKRRVGVQPSALLLLGDQIYYDATAEIFDTEAARAKFEQRYVDAFQAKHFRDLVRRIPTYMGVDDHEIFEGWEPAIEHNELRRKTREWGIDAYKCFQQLHGPCNGTTDDGSHGLWYWFEQCGFPFFVMDTRTERERDVHDPGCVNATIVKRGQMRALERFLDKAQNEGTGSQKTRPKFVACSSVLAPALRASIEHPAYALRDDSWAGFPASRAHLLGYIAENKIENVVFLSGDVHCSMVAELTYEGVTTARGAALKSYCITASPFYSPYPFINHNRNDFVSEHAFVAEHGATVHYRTYPASWVERDSFSRVDIAPAQNNGWRLDVWAIGRDKKSKPTHTPIDLA